MVVCSCTVVLLVINIFTRKVYCRYIALGAALAIPTKLRLFDWLKRRKECGTPCQLCAVECEVQAIHPDGTINATSVTTVLIAGRFTLMRTVVLLSGEEKRRERKSSCTLKSKSRTDSGRPAETSPLIPSKLRQII